VKAAQLGFDLRPEQARFISKKSILALLISGYQCREKFIGPNMAVLSNIRGYQMDCRVRSKVRCCPIRANQRHDLRRPWL
jgi:hypothetical protein